MTTARRSHPGRRRVCGSRSARRGSCARDAARRRVCAASICPLRWRRERRPKMQRVFRQARSSAASRVRLTAFTTARGSTTSIQSRCITSSAMPSSRYRRLVSPRLAIERLMLLDAVLTTPDVEWLTTAAEKAAYLGQADRIGLCGDEPDVIAGGRLDARGGTARRAPDRRGVGRPHGSAVPGNRSRRRTRSGRSFRAMPRCSESRRPGRSRIVFPRPLDRVYDAYQTVIHEELESPLTPATIAELKWYFEHPRQSDA